MAATSGWAATLRISPASTERVEVGVPPPQKTAPIAGTASSSSTTVSASEQIGLTPPGSMPTARNHRLGGRAELRAGDSEGLGDRTVADAERTRHPDQGEPAVRQLEREGLHRRRLIQLRPVQIGFAANRRVVMNAERDASDRESFLDPHGHAFTEPWARQRRCRASEATRSRMAPCQGRSPAKCRPIARIAISVP